MKKLIFCFYFFSCSLISSANLLSDSVKISLLTCQPGTEVYATFGHSALYVQDKGNNIDLVFNYGIFDFEEESFLYKFVKGETYYVLGVNDFESFKYSYERRQCGIFAQELNLTKEEKERLFVALVGNAKPENRRYLYNFFYDNCATRIRDIVEKNVDREIVYPEFEQGEYVFSGNIINSVFTYRDYVAQYAYNSTWLKLGIDILIGAPADTSITEYYSMFLPDYLSQNYDCAFFAETNDKIQPLVLSNQQILPDFPREKSANFPFITMFGVLLIAVFVSAYEIRKKRQVIWFDFILFFTAGLIGIVVTFVEFFSIHPAVFPNYNILWLHPLQMVFAVLLLIKPVREKLQVYHYFNLTMVVVAAVLGLTEQVFNPAFFPLLGAMAVRNVKYIIWKKSE